MKIVINNTIPFYGYLAMCIYPFVFVRKDARRVTEVDINHEKIHGMQQIETHIASAVILSVLSILGILSPWFILCAPLVYFILYATEYLVRFFAYFLDGKEAYRNISYEQEAYMNEGNMQYLSERKLFSQYRYFFKKTYKK